MVWTVYGNWTEMGVRRQDAHRIPSSLRIGLDVLDLRRRFVSRGRHSERTHHSWPCLHANVKRTNGLLVEHCGSAVWIDDPQIGVDLVRVERVQLWIRIREHCELTFEFASGSGQ